jgi:hypothetical protein
MSTMNKKLGGGKQWFGVSIIIVGILFLLKSVGLEFPDWVLSWPMYIVGVGILIGLANGFKDWSWLIVSLFGLAFLVDDITGIQINVISFIIPVSLILVGLRIIFKKKDKTIHVFDEATGVVVEDVPREDHLDLVAVFAGNKKIIVSKNFKGGSLVSAFGGNEINLLNADFTGEIRIEVVQFFGGTKIVVPSNWIIKSEIVSVFGGLDDKRSNLTISGPEDKVVTIEGVSVFAGIDIRSY